MTVSGGSAGDGAATDSSGVRNSLPPVTDRAVALARIGENFELTGRHAEGATCEVFKGHHVALDVAIAVKILRPEFAGDPCFLERMRIEAQVLPRLRSPHIVRCFDRGFTDDGRPFTVLEFLRGETLETLLSQLKRFDELSAIEIGLELLEALATTHAHGVVHRDVSLRNLIVHRSEHEPAVLKLIDYGFAWIMPDAPESAPEPPLKRERGVAVGTPRFTSPEVARGRGDVDARADLYSAGVVLYTLLAGRDPFAGLRTPEGVLEAHAYRTVPPLSLHARGVSKELEAVVMRLLQKDRAHRYESAKQAARALYEAGEVARHRAHQRFPVPPAAKSSPMLAAGEHCGPYTVTRLIDAGGFFEVYEAEATGGRKRPVAIKIAKREVAMGARQRARFLEMARQLASIRHPNFATVHQAGEHEGSPWISMALVEGVTLCEHLKRKRTLPAAPAIKLAYGIAGALRQLHRLGIVHGNLSPESVMVTPAGEACVIDTAFANALSESQRARSSQPRGRMAYQSPEALTGDELDPRSDIYSWGLIVFEMLTGRLPYSTPLHHSALNLEMLVARLNDPEQRDTTPHLPKSLWALLESATTVYPRLRPEGFSDVCTTLDHACEGIPLAHPLIVTPQYAIAVNGGILVQVWRSPPSIAAVDEADRLNQNANLSAGLVVIDSQVALSSSGTLPEFSALVNAMAIRVGVVAIVCEGQVPGGANLRNALSHGDFLQHHTASRGVFSSIGSAMDWLTRYRSGIVGLSDLTAVVNALRRRMKTAAIVQCATTPVEAPSPRSAEPRAKRNMLIKRAGSLLLIRENCESPTDQDWNELLTFLTMHRRELDKIKILVRTDGGAVTAPQRRRLAETLAHTHVLVAVVSDGIRVRFGGAVIALFQKKYRQFSVNELSEAYRHLNLTADEQRLAESVLQELEASLDAQS